MNTNIVAIVGRPNVGKSALFNRLVGKRISIVDGTRGVTRDRLVGQVNWQERSFQIVDTGGIEFEAADNIKKSVQEQAEVAIKDAAAVLFVVDATEGIMPLDTDIMGLLRRCRKPVLLVVNKVDNEKVQPLAQNFRTLGVQEMFPVSALHGLGIRVLLDRVIQLVPESSAAAAAAPLKIAIVGKPNVGKSSYVNAVLQEKRLIVDDCPGTTRDSIDIHFSWKGKDILLIDTAGMKRKRKVDSAPEFFSVTRSLHTVERCDIVVMMIDARSGPTDEDSKIADLAARTGKGILICINKWDLMEKASTEDYAASVLGKLPFVGFAPIIFISALKRRNIYKVLDEVLLVNEQLDAKISTGMINKAVTEAQANLQHPYKGKKRFKIYYTTQTGSRPPTFTFFVNDVSILDRSYEKYLLNQLRNRFGFEGVPVRLRFRNRR
ncbi:MAG TPA: ribosome biogenesis GTPase Der [bacterium]|nr:ribosome biogenesis GTPase Der [bacterium]